MLTAVRELQIPLLAALLLGGCAAKAWRVLRTRSLTAAMMPTGLLPLRLRRPVMMTMCATEFALGIALIATAGKVGAGGAGLAATTVRAGTALFFLVAVGALNETRQRRPDAGCGCFGEFSDTPIGWRTITRAGVLCAGARRHRLRHLPPGPQAAHPGGGPGRGHRRSWAGRNWRVCRYLRDSRRHGRRSYRALAPLA